MATPVMRELGYGAVEVYSKAEQLRKENCEVRQKLCQEARVLQIFK